MAVDNSGAFRMDPDVPLVVPEVNAEQAAQPAEGDHREPQLHHAVDDGGDGRAAPRVRGCSALVVASYQAASGAGQAGIDRLRAEMAAVAGKEVGVRGGDVAEALAGLAPPSRRSPRRSRSTSCPWAGSLKDDGWSSEELKVRNESRKILGIPDLRVSATCVRVPVITTHALAVHATFAPRGVRRGRAQGAGRAAHDRAARRPGGGRVADARRRRRRRPHLGRPDPAGAGLPEHAGAVRVRRQPAQGRRAQHLRDRRDGGGGSDGRTRS